MKIAYISYEHPLGITGGGIGTYIGQVARLMAGRGHEVEVFSALFDQDKTVVTDGYNLHLVKSASIAEFRDVVLIKFSERHSIVNFEIIESAEYGADALEIKKKFKHLPLTVKLHTPTFLVTLLNSPDFTLLKKMRYIFGGLLRGKLVDRYWAYTKTHDPEYELFMLADSVCSPSQSLKRIITEKWGSKAISVIPNIFEPSISSLSEMKPTENLFKVAFVGKLEVRKGILDLVKAIPNILKKDQNIQFKFAGSASDSPIKNVKMDEYMASKLKIAQANIEFMGFVNNSEITAFFKQMDICVIPSLWENFPTVCLEAMASGITVIGTNNGGMADIIEHEKTGMLIPPNSPKKLAKAILALKKDPALCKKLAENGQKSIQQKYNGRVIGEMIEDFYEYTIRKHGE